METVAYVVACVVLPVLWGMLIHWAFLHIRRQRSSGDRSADNWPDYQI